MPYQKIWTLDDLTIANVRLWNRSKWPHGIKARLSEHAHPEIPHNETVVYKEYIGDATYWIITTKSLRDGSGQVNIHRWYFPHPRVCDDLRPKYVRGPGFYIPSRVASSWRSSTEKLLSLTDKEIIDLDGYYKSSISYGTRFERSDTYHNIRFFIENKRGTKYFQIQDFIYSNARQAHIRSRSAIYTKLTSQKLLLELIKALTWAENKEIAELEVRADTSIAIFKQTFEVE